MNEMLDAPVIRATYYIHDHPGNTRVNYYYSCSGDNEGYILESVLNYYPYGKILEEYIPFGPSEKYLTTHHERDLESGLDYRGARMYDSDVGRFLSLDPLAMEFPAWSDYNYVLGNPVMFIDPDGRAPEPPRETIIAIRVYENIEVQTDELSWNFRQGIHFKTRTEQKEIGYLDLTLKLRDKTTDSGTDFTEVSATIGRKEEIKGNFSVDVNMEVGEVSEDKNMESTSQDIGLNFSISENGDSGFTLTVGGANKSGTRSGGLELTDTKSSTNKKGSFKLYSIESTKNGISVLQSGENEITTNNGKYTIQVTDLNFVQDIENKDK
ncbi:MAG: RHS repeat-associated core domain-containing protein [Bacteroidota bacterium]